MLLKLLVIAHLSGMFVIAVCVIGCMVADGCARFADRIGVLRDALRRGMQLQHGVAVPTVLVTVASGIALAATLSSMFHGG